MKKLNRYYFHPVRMELDIAQPDCQHGEWVKWDDIKKLAKELSKKIRGLKCNTY